MTYPRWPLIVLVAAAALCAAQTSAALADAPEASSAEFFESKVRPVLVDRCFECHGPDAAPEGNFRIDSLAGMLKGGDLGPAIVPGDAQASLLIRAIKHDDVVEMPPKSKLPRQQIVDLAAWVAAGAPWPGAEVPTRPAGTSDDAAASIITDEDRQFWAFVPPADPPVPDVRDNKWPAGPLDRFVLAGLESKGLRPAPPADKRTLLRRLTYDLHGLPPTIEQIDAFLADESPDAVARVVDRLLASPRYGERWGRRWLDLARYADSNGMDENMAMAHAWRYRDWVIAAFNRDLPYDQFIVHQIAGDLLPAADHATNVERLIATGFLVLGPKMLAEDDPVKMEMDIIDEQVDTIGRAVMGLSLGCARCHDHKFDPISMADYYSLAGIFKSTKTMENYKVVAMWSERSLGTDEQQRQLAEHQKNIDAVQAACKTLEKDVEQPLEATPAAGLGDHLLAIGAREQQKRTLAEQRAALKQLNETKPTLPAALAVAERKPINLRIHRRGSHLTLGREVPRQFPEILAGASQQSIGANHSGRLELARWLAQDDHPLTARVMVNRIWQGHFGEGLVRSVDNFGKLGQRPDNQPLLDWLARRFVDSGWSIKAMHRLILLSSAYRMSTAYDEQAAAVDPENRLLWRMNRRRLQAEEIRDTLLAASGRLTTSMGGTLVGNQNHTYITSTASSNNTNYQSPRRSVYLPVVRSAVYEVFSAFDFADPSTANGQRPSTTVAPQALFMMNSPLMLAQSRAMAERLLAEADDDQERVRTAYESVYARRPSQEETARAVRFVADYQSDLAGQKIDPAEARVRAWQAFCRVVLSANEAVYLN